MRFFRHFLLIVADFHIFFHIRPLTTLGSSVSMWLRRGAKGAWMAWGLQEDLQLVLMGTRQEMPPVSGVRRLRLVDMITTTTPTPAFYDEPLSPKKD